MGSYMEPAISTGMTLVPYIFLLEVQMLGAIQAARNHTATVIQVNLAMLIQVDLARHPAGPHRLKTDRSLYRAYT